MSWCVVSATFRGIAIAAVLAATAVACGSAQGQASSVQTLLAGTTSALDAAHTFRITLDGTESQNGRSESLHGEGVVDWTARTVDLHLTGAGQNERLIMTPGGAYVHGALASEALETTHRSWLGFTGANEAKGGVLGGLDPLGDPLSTLSSLRSHLTKITSEGDVELDGVSTTELKGSLAKLAGTKGGAAITVWIDQQGRVRQLHMLAGGNGNGTADITERFSDFGLPVHIAAPPASQVVDFDKLLEKAFKNLPPSDLPTPPAGFGPGNVTLPVRSGHKTAK